MDFIIKDVVEKAPGEVKAPVLPQADTSGFPLPKKRISAFKALRTGKFNNTTIATPAAPQSQNPSEGTREATHNGLDIAAERRRINEENSARVADMSPAEIAREREELMSNLSPSLIEMLMKRSNIDQDYDDDQAEIFDKLGSPSGIRPNVSADPPEIKVEDTTTAMDPPPPVIPTSQPEPTLPTAPVAAVAIPAETAAPTKTSDDATTTKYERGADDMAPKTPVDIPFEPRMTHHPKPDLSEIDPSDPNFLESMQKKYFPDLSADPGQLAWMAPVPTEHSIADKESPYYPGQSSIPISALRFDFRGRLLSPKKSREIPVTKGLHHHGQAPEAAGYTVAELAIYSRSAVASQRCLAFQTLGRVFYRLGKGDWGNGEMGQGIWASAMEGRVMDTLWEAANREGGHLSSQAYAAEALWLYEQGGWKEKYKGR